MVPVPALKSAIEPRRRSWFEPAVVVSNVSFTMPVRLADVYMLTICLPLAPTVPLIVIMASPPRPAAQPTARALAARGGRRQDPRMPRLQRKSFAHPDEVRRFTHGHVDIVNLDETILGRFKLEPGWRWSKDV